jgi:hypothetical protein
MGIVVLQSGAFFWKILQVHYFDHNGISDPVGFAARESQHDDSQTRFSISATVDGI